MKILSINFNHDGAGLILDHGVISAYVNTERFSRYKKHPGIRESDLDELLSQAGISLSDLDLVILVNLGMTSPEIYDRFGTDLQHTVLTLTFSEARDRVSIRGVDIPCWINPEHFLCHSSVAYYFSPFESAACFSYDPLGSGVYFGCGNKLEVVAHRKSYVGRLYNDISIRSLDLGGIFGAGKTMALASFCDAGVRGLVEPFLRAIPEERLATEHGVGEIFRYAANLAANFPQFYEDKWSVTSAYIAQRFLELELEKILGEIARYAGDERYGRNLCLSGGAALNTVANQICYENSPFDAMYLHPACGDDGTAIGAALYYWHHVHGQPKVDRSNRAAMFSVREYRGEVDRSLAKFASRLKCVPSADYRRIAAEKLASGKILGWFDGASEIGPRSLGHRSILCDPTRESHREHLNANIKKRESFRPFAPAVLEERCEEFFDIDYSPFMLRAARVKAGALPAVTHVDGTARVQTVRRCDNEVYYDLIAEFGRITGTPIVLNTSFNINGEPLVETPEDAIKTFLASDIDCLVFPEVIVEKNS